MSKIMVSIASIEGESAQAGYENQIECDGMQHGIDMQVVSAGSTRIEGASIHGCITLRHQIDKATPKLRLAATKSSVLGNVTISRLRGASAEAAEIITITSTQVAEIFVVTPVSGSGGTAGEVVPAALPYEVFKLDYDEIRWEYRHSVDGVVASTVSGSYSTTNQTNVTAIA